MLVALLVIDVHDDFCSGGALAVADAEANLPVINRLIGEFRTVFFTQDWHPPGHVSFASSHPGQRPFSPITMPCSEQMLWPDHCVETTSGAAFHPALDIPLRATVLRRGIRRASTPKAPWVRRGRAWQRPA